MKNSVEIKEVKSKKDFYRFWNFQLKLYKSNKFFVPPLRYSELKTFMGTNPMSKNCEFKNWLAFEEGKIVGRITGIINNDFNKNNKIKQARFTNFDCYYNQSIANKLFETAEEWATEKGMQEIIGPFGFTNLDKHGMLIEGFDQLACQSSNYNHPYYKDLIESYGFYKKHDWVERKITLPSAEITEFQKFSKLVNEKYKIRSAVISKTSLKLYSNEIFDLYNKTYESLYGISLLNNKHKKYLIKNFFGSINLDFVSVLTDNECKVVGFGIGIPSLSKDLQKSKGRLFLFFIHRLINKTSAISTLDLLLIGIHPNYQRKGLNALIFNDLTKGIFKNKVRYMETTQNLESNTSVQNLWSRFESYLHKRSRLYIKELKN
jgi:hypothetical protein